MKKRTGYLFRRKDGKHIPIDDPHYPDAKIYLCYMVNYQRKTVALGTANKRTAQIKAEKLMGGMAYSNHESYLMHLVEMGELAKRELSGEQGKRLQTPITEVYKNYLASKERPMAGDKTLRQYKTTWTRFSEYLQASIKHIEEVTKPMCADYIDDLEKSLKRSSCEKHVNQLKTIFKTISTRPSPWGNLHVMKADDRIQHRRLSLKECRALVKHAKGADERLVILIAYYTGLRMGHAAKMKAEQFDFKRGLYSFRPDDYQKGKEVPVLMPIHPSLSIAIEQHVVEQNISTGFITPTAVRKYGTSGVTLSGAIMSIFKAAKVIETKEGTVGLHALRVTFKSQLEDASVSHTISSYLMGHSLGKMHKTYTRLEVSKIRKPIETAITKL